jgi:hypothetical protein
VCLSGVVTCCDSLPVRHCSFAPHFLLGFYVFANRTSAAQWTCATETAPWKSLWRLTQLNTYIMYVRLRIWCGCGEGVCKSVYVGECGCGCTLIWVNARLCMFVCHCVCVCVRVCVCAWACSICPSNTTHQHWPPCFAHHIHCQPRPLISTDHPAFLITSIVSHDQQSIDLPQTHSQD